MATPIDTPGRVHDGLQVSGRESRLPSNPLESSARSKYDNGVGSCSVPGSDRQPSVLPTAVMAPTPQHAPVDREHSAQIPTSPTTTHSSQEKYVTTEGKDAANGTHMKSGGDECDVTGDTSRTKAVVHATHDVHVPSDVDTIVSRGSQISGCGVSPATLASMATDLLSILPHAHGIVKEDPRRGDDDGTKFSASAGSKDAGETVRSSDPAIEHPTQKASALGNLVDVVSLALPNSQRAQLEPQRNSLRDETEGGGSVFSDETQPTERVSSRGSIEEGVTNRSNSSGTLDVTPGTISCVSAEDTAVTPAVCNLTRGKSPDEQHAKGKIRQSPFGDAVVGSAAATPATRTTTDVEASVSSSELLRYSLQSTGEPAGNSGAYSSENDRDRSREKLPEDSQSLPDGTATSSASLLTGSGAMVSTHRVGSSLATGHTAAKLPRVFSIDYHSNNCAEGDTVDVAQAALSHANAADATIGSVSGGSRSAVRGNGLWRSDRQSASIAERESTDSSGSGIQSSGTPNLSCPEAHTHGEGEGFAGDFAANVNPNFTSATAPVIESTSPVSAQAGDGSDEIPTAGDDSGTRSTADISPVSGADSVTATGRKRKRACTSDPHDDMMHAMCMICLEKLSDPTDRGAAKLLGLLDSCSHRYCYTCILEWSKVTNKCPQCKSRFHTIKAVKELRRSNSRYRGVAVSVEDRDQTYSFVDVRDVAVLDPDIRCHQGCLLRGAVDAFQLRGWEFSVQCEDCSVWFHGVCVGFREEQTVPDRWFCGPCTGQPHQTVNHTTSPAATNSARSPCVSRGGSSSRRGRVRGRVEHGRQSFQGVGQLSAPVPRTGNNEAVAGMGTQATARDEAGCGLARIAAGERQMSSNGMETGATGTANSAAADAAAAAPAAPPVVAAARGRGRPRGSLNRQRSASPLSQLATHGTTAPSSNPHVPTPGQPRGRGRPRGSLNRPKSSSPSMSQTSASPASPQSGSVAQGPPRGRGRPRGSRNKSPATPGVPRSTPPTNSPPCPSPSSPSLGTSQELPPFPPALRQSPQQQLEDERQRNGVDESVPPAFVRPPEVKRDVRPVLPKPLAPSLLRTLRESQATDLCDICGFDTEPQNLIVYCDSCGIGVHQTCYGISQIPSREWYCSPCSAGVHPSTLGCRFCPVKGGALKRCTDGTWGHILCAFWIPECCFIDPRKMEPIGSINIRGQAGEVSQFLPPFRFRKCYICGSSTGCAIRCQSPACKFHLHPMCGSKAGSVYMEIETSTKTGADGTEHESVNLVAKCPKHTKNRTSSGKGRKSCATPAFGADPLRVIGKMIEIADPEKGGAVVLEGKATWFDPNRSRYCLVRSSQNGGGDGRESGASSSEGDGGCIGGGDETGSCAHWITVETLIQVKAVCLERKSGKRLIVEALPSVEEEEADTMERSAGDTRVKLEVTDEPGNGEEEHEDADMKDQPERHEGSMLPGSDELVTSDAGADERVESGAFGPSESTTGAASEESKRDGESQRVEAAALSGPKSSDSAVNGDAISLQNPARGSGTLSRIGWHPPTTEREREEANETPRDSSPNLHRSGSTSTEREIPPYPASVDTSAPSSEPERIKLRARAASDRRQELLPSVQVSHEEPDPFERYPIRGRRRRSMHVLLDPPGSGFIGDDDALAKRSRLSSSERTCPPETAAIAEAFARPVVSTAADQEVTPRSQTEAEEPSAYASAGVDDGPSVATHDEEGRRGDASIFALEPGWPGGVDLLGQVPVMRVRTFQVAGCQETTFFAGAYAQDDEGSVTHGNRLASRYSFEFERLEREAVAARTDKASCQNDAAAAAVDSLMLWADDTRKREEGEEVRDSTVQSESETDLRRNLRVLRGREQSFDGGKGQSMDGQVRSEEAPAVKRESSVEDATTSRQGIGEESSCGVRDGDVDNPSNGLVGDMFPMPRKDVLGLDLNFTRDDRSVEVNQVVGTAESGRSQDDTSDPTQGSYPDNTNEMQISSDGHSSDEEDVETAVTKASNNRQDANAFNSDHVDDNLNGLAEGNGANVDRVASPSVSIGAGNAFEPSESQLLPEAASPYCCSDVSSDFLSDKDNESEVDSMEARSADANPTSAGQAQAFANEETVETESPPPLAEEEQQLQRQARQEQEGIVLALRTIVREQLQNILRSASKGGEAALAGGNGDEIFQKIALDVEEELFERLYKDETGGREYKAKYKQLLLSLGNVRNYRLAASVLAGSTTPIDLATKDAVGLLHSLNSSLNCLAIPLAGRSRQAPEVPNPKMNGTSRRGKMMMLW